MEESLQNDLISVLWLKAKGLRSCERLEENRDNAELNAAWRPGEKGEAQQECLAPFVFFILIILKFEEKLAV